MQAPKPPSTKPKKKVQSDSQGLRKAKGFIDRALWELRAGPVLSKPIRKWLVDSLDEKANSPVRLVIKQKVGQPRGNLGMTFDGVRMEAAEYVAALMHASKTPGMYDSAITKSCDRYGVGRTALKTEYGEHWKNTKYPIHSIAYFEGRETADEAQAYSELAQKYREEFESSPDYDDTQEANARSEADHIAELIGAALARQIGGKTSRDLSTQMAAWLRKCSPNLLTSEIAVQFSEKLVRELGEHLIQGFCEEMAKRLVEDIPRELSEAISSGTTPA